MAPSTRKRVLILIGVCGVLYLLIRYLLFHGALLAPPPHSRHSAGTPVLVMVFYEALCPDSKHFILKQLMPAYKEAKPIMDIRLVPYGKAETIPNADGTYSFECQHGPVECKANMYHACAIEMIEDTQTQLDVVACMIRDNRLPKEAFLKCATQYSLQKTDLILKCVEGTDGAELLKLYGEATNALRPKISFIPTITLDGTQHRQAAILKNLLAEVCKLAGDSEEAKEICKAHQ